MIRSVICRIAHGAVETSMLQDEPLGGCCDATYPCDACNEPNTVLREAELCMSCEERLCKGCGKVQRTRWDLHLNRDNPLTEPLPCGRCNECCNCFAFEEVAR